MNGENFDLVPVDDGVPATYQPARTPVDYSGLHVPEAGSPSQWMPDAAAGTSVVLFGQPLSAGVTAEAAQRDLDTLINVFTQAMQQQRIPQQHTDAAVDWFQRAAAGGVPREWPAHPYNLDGLSFPREDQPYTTAFCNAMHKQRVPQPVVRQMLGWYAQLLLRLQAQQQPQPQQRPSQGNTLDDLSDAEYAYVMRRAESDRRAGTDELRTRWDHEFEPRMRVVQNYFAGLPAHERDYLESAITKGGVLAANSPDFIDRMYHHALGPLPTGGALQAAISQLESRMRTGRRAWDRDEKSQLRYRELLRLRDG